MPETASAASIKARLLQRWEQLPDKYVDAAVGMLQLDPEWVWVAEQEGPEFEFRIVGYIVACPCHNTVMTFRTFIDQTAPKVTGLILYRRFFNDCQKRGFKGFFSFLNTDMEKELHWAVIMQKLGGVVTMQSLIAVAAMFPPEGRF